MQRQVLHSSVPCEDKEHMWVSTPATGEGRTFRSLSTSKIKAIHPHWLEKHTTQTASAHISEYLSKTVDALWEGICRFVSKPGSHSSEKRRFFLSSMSQLCSYILHKRAIFKIWFFLVSLKEKFFVCIHPALKCHFKMTFKVSCVLELLLQ